LAPADDGLPGTTPGFHYDDEPADLVAADMIEFPTRRGQMPEWGTPTIPPCAMSMLSPGAVAPEAASITAPVFVGAGERDVCPDPWSEPQAYKAATDVTVYICPRMSHMHNFASTREMFWARLYGWAETLRGRASGRSVRPQLPLSRFPGPTVDKLRGLRVIERSGHALRL
jgi:pimeloyl-ACP methyl ester carboxylesterase